MLWTVFLLLALIFATSAADYCRLCSNHVACNNNGQFKSTCSRDAIIVPMTNDAIKAFLDAHNNVRNKIAGGKEPGFRSASKMMAVQWDFELAYLAELNVKTCQMEHDGCIRTDKFPSPGQNLYWLSESRNHDPNINNVLQDSVYSWYDEVKDSNQADINDCCGGNRFMQIGHFTQIVRENVVAIGCAASRYTSQNGWKSTLIACNYSYGNMLGTPVYISGASASQCPRGRDPVFENLCKSETSSPAPAPPPAEIPPRNIPTPETPIIPERRIIPEQPVIPERRIIPEQPIIPPPAENPSAEFSVERSEEFSVERSEEFSVERSEEFPSRFPFELPAEIPTLNNLISNFRNFSGWLENLFNIFQFQS